MTGAYTVTRSHGCICITGGSMPVDDLVALVAAWSGPANASQMPDDEWYMDTLLAEALGANFVFGPRHATAAWRTLLNIVPPHLKETPA